MGHLFRILTTLGFVGVLLITLFSYSQDSVTESRRNAIVNAVEKASPGVVAINVLKYQTDELDPFFELFGFPIRRRATIGIGSGFIFRPDGYILTNYHVLENASKIESVTLPSGRKLEVEVIGGDYRTDIAVLKAKGSNFPYIPMGNSDDLLIGEWVIAIGNPFGTFMSDPRPTVSVGVVSAVHRRVSRSVTGGERLYQDLIQTDAAINPGNSGGPLVNCKGEVVGINTMIFSKTGGYQGVSFAIPINRAKRVVEEIIQFGRRRDPWFGLKGESLDSLDPRLLRELGITISQGVFVTRILKESPAYRAGLRPGDVIIEINKQPVEDPLDVDFINWDLFVGDSVTMKFFRDGKIHTIVFNVEEINK
ncbi:MAG: trypsin-like peptidase domain-containing protein [Candidatus Hydrogenedentes bacterium]|nr:trypsin-like peptidase domain-containing protein [Candidatus Hydrogenedentota bacterium]